LQDKGQYNHKGQRHGHWLTHYSNGNIWWEANFVNGIIFGFSEYSYRDDVGFKNKEYNAL
jgi:antitoxin component YwqK of YwqJK toxin-antitoxin module